MNRPRPGNKSYVYNNNSLLHPPQIPSNLRYKHHFRYRATAAGDIQPTNTQALASFGSMCTVVNSTLQSIHSSFKISKIQCWFVAATAGTPVTCSVEWIGQQNYPSVEMSETSVSPSVYSCLTTRPPPNSLASFWQLPSNTITIGRIIFPAGALLDIWVELIVRDDETAAATTVGSATLGSMYWPALDGAVSNVMRPVSLQTTA